MSYLGVDIGTSRIKAVLTDNEGAVIRQESLANEAVEYTEDTVEINPTVFLKSMEHLIGGFSGREDPIRAVNFSCLGTAMIPVDKKGNPLYNGISSLDKRARGHLDWNSERGLTPSSIYHTTGQPPHIVAFLHNYLWLRHRHPEIIDATSKFLSLVGLLVRALCGQAVTDPSWASRTMLMDIHEREWSPGILQALSLDIEKLPRIAAATDAFELSGASSARFGLNRKTKVLPGSLDSVCTFEGGGGGHGDVLVDVVGTYEELMDSSPGACPDSLALARETFYHPGITPDRYLHYQRMETGYILKEFFRVFFESDIQPAVMDSITPEPGGFFISPDRETLAGIKDGGVPEFGFNAGDSGSGRLLLLKALLEGICYRLKDAVAAHEEPGRHIKGLVVIGGGATSENLLQMKANVLDKELYITKYSECSLIGSIISILIGTGKCSPGGARDAMQNPVIRTVKPDMKTAAEYRRRRNGSATFEVGRLWRRDADQRHRERGQL